MKIDRAEKLKSIRRFLLDYCYKRWGFRKGLRWSCSFIENPERLHVVIRIGRKNLAVVNIKASELVLSCVCAARQVEVRLDEILNKESEEE